MLDDNPLEPDRFSTSPIIYTHVQNLRGVMESCYYQSTVVATTVPGFNTLGVYARNYLVAHGYIESAIGIIVEVRNIARTNEEFALALSFHGLPVLEGLFLWHLSNL